MNAIARIDSLGAPVRATPLRVALFSGNYNYHMDGPVRALNRLVGRLESRGIPVMVFAPTSPTPACAPTGTLVSVPSIALPGRSEYRLGLRLSDQIKRQLVGFRPTLFHLAAPDIVGYAALRLAHRWRTPAVASFHTRFDTYVSYYGFAWLQHAVRSYLRHFYNKCTHLYAPSESMADELRSQKMCGDIRLWGRGVDCAAFAPTRRDPTWRRSLGIADDEIVVAFVGRVVLEKGLDVLVASLKALRAGGVRVRALIVGDGPAKSWLMAQLPAAIATGYLKGDDLARAYASADIFLNPSLTETFGNVTAEAMASGLPAVCADATGSRSLVLDGITGYLARSQSPCAYAAALATLARQPGLRRDMGTAARARAITLDWDCILDALIDNYFDALTNAGRTAAFDGAEIAAGLLAWPGRTA